MSLIHHVKIGHYQMHRQCAWNCFKGLEVKSIRHIKGPFNVRNFVFFCLLSYKASCTPLRDRKLWYNCQFASGIAIFFRIFLLSITLPQSFLSVFLLRGNKKNNTYLTAQENPNKLSFLWVVSTSREDMVT